MTITVSSFEDETVIEQSKINDNPLLEHKYRSYCHLLSICLNAALSSFYIGYSLVAASAMQFTYIYQIYNFNDWNQNWAQSFVYGAIPIGAIIGALSSSIILSKFSRRNGFLVTNLFAVIGLLLLFITNPFLLLIGRVIQGVCTGIFSAIVPLYINQIVTPDSANLGSLNQILISTAQGFCFLLYLILVLILEVQEQYELVWFIISQFLLLTILIQTFMFFVVFPYQTPKYLYSKGRHNEGALLIAKIYRDQYVDEAINKLQVIGSSIDSDSGPQKTVKSQLTKIAPSKYKNQKIAIFFAVHIALMQQMTGVNVIVGYGKQSLSHFIHSDHIVDFLQVIITSIPAVMAVLTIKLMNKKGRKYLIQLGIIFIGISLAIVLTCLIITPSSDEVNEDSPIKLITSILVVLAMLLFMSFFGLTLGPIVWLYIPEIVQPNIIPYSTMANLSGAAFCFVIPPLIPRIVCFSLFVGWAIVSFFINAKYMVETKDKSRRRIFNQYKKKKLF